MTKPTIVSRASLGRPLTYTELDTNFTNLRDAVFQVEGLNDDSTGGNFTVEQGGDFTLRGGSNVTIGVDSGNRIITVNTSGGDVLSDTTPQLGGDLDVNGKKIVSVSNGSIILSPNGAGYINLESDYIVLGDLNAGVTVTSNGTGDLTIVTGGGSTGSIYLNEGSNGDILITPHGTGNLVLDNLKWPQSDGAAGYVLKTDGAQQLSWVAQSGGGGGISNVVEDATPQLGGDLDVNGQKIISAANGNIILDPAGTGDITLQGADANTYILVDGSANNLIELNAKAGTKQSGLDLSPANATTSMVYYDSAAHADSGQYFALKTNGIELVVDENVTGNILISHPGTGKIELAGAVKISATSGTPTTYQNGYYEGMLVTPASWLKITVGATTYYLPLFT